MNMPKNMRTLLWLSTGVWVVSSCAEMSPPGTSAVTGTDCRSSECPGDTQCSTDDNGDYGCRPPAGGSGDDVDAGGGECVTPLDAGPSDSGETGAAGDAEATDAEATDAGTTDAGTTDVPGTDSGTAGTGGDACGRFRRLLKPHPPNVARVMLVVDRSYSMVENEDRWTPITDALGAVTAALGGGVQFGLLLFPHPTQRRPPEGVPPPCIPGVVNVEPGPDRSEDIVEGLRVGAPVQNMGTPTAAALATAAAWLRRNPTDNDYILLATDGGPGCNTRLDPSQCVCNARASNCCLWEAAHSCLDDVATTALIGDLAESGIRTMVLGITEGQEDDGDACRATDICGPNSTCVYGGQECINGTCRNQLNRVLDAMAVAGQTAVDGHHFEVADLAELQRQVDAAVGSVAPCVYDLEAGLAEHADRLVVTIDAEPLRRDRNHQDGWDVGDGTIEFYGQACRALRDGRPHEINAHCE